MLTHRNLVANICQTIAHQRVREDDRVIAVLPFFHIYGLVVLMNLPLYRGATIVTMPRFDLAEFLRVVQQYRITRAWVVPPIVLALAKQPPVDEFDLSSLEFMLSGAAPLSAELEVACGERLGLPHAAGLRPDRDQPDHSLRPRRPRRANARLDRPRGPEHRVPHRRRLDRQ